MHKGGLSNSKREPAGPQVPAGKMDRKYSINWDFGWFLQDQQNLKRFLCFVV